MTTKGGVEVHEYASADSKVLVKLKKDRPVTVLEKDDQWAHVTVSINDGAKILEGYILSDCLSSAESNETEQSYVYDQRFEYDGMVIYRPAGLIVDEVKSFKANGYVMYHQDNAKYTVTITPKHIAFGKDGKSWIESSAEDYKSKQERFNPTIRYSNKDGFKTAIVSYLETSSNGITYNTNYGKSIFYDNCISIIMEGNEYGIWETAEQYDNWKSEEKPLNNQKICDDLETVASSLFVYESNDLASNNDVLNNKFLFDHDVSVYRYPDTSDIVYTIPANGGKGDTETLYTLIRGFTKDNNGQTWARVNVKSTKNVQLTIIGYIILPEPKNPGQNESIIPSKAKITLMHPNAYNKKLNIREKDLKSVIPIGKLMDKEDNYCGIVYKNGMAELCRIVSKEPVTVSWDVAKSAMAGDNEIVFMGERTGRFDYRYEYFGAHFYRPDWLVEDYTSKPVPFDGSVFKHTQLSGYKVTVGTLGVDESYQQAALLKYQSMKEMESSQEHCRINGIDAEVVTGIKTEILNKERSCDTYFEKHVFLANGFLMKNEYKEHHYYETSDQLKEKMGDSSVIIDPLAVSDTEYLISGIIGNSSSRSVFYRLRVHPEQAISVYGYPSSTSTEVDIIGKDIDYVHDCEMFYNSGDWKNIDIYNQGITITGYTTDEEGNLWYRIENDYYEPGKQRSCHHGYIRADRNEKGIYNQITVKEELYAYELPITYSKQCTSGAFGIAASKTNPAGPEPFAKIQSGDIINVLGWINPVEGQCSTDDGKSPSYEWKELCFVTPITRDGVLYLCKVPTVILQRGLNSKRNYTKYEYYSPITDKTSMQP